MLLLAHGFPPQELGGTERYTQRVAQGMAARGWSVQAIVATRSPGHAQAQVLVEERPWGRLHRVVNNIPWPPLSQGGHHPLVAGRVRRLMESIEHDLVHINHLLFLSPRLPFRAPTVFTLHDAWGWCPRAGSLLHMGQAPCPGPQDQRCAACYAQFAQGTPHQAALAQAASLVGKVVDPQRLQSLWRRLPSGLRARANQGAPEPPNPRHAAERRATHLRCLQAMDLRLSPSRFLGEEAELQSLGPVAHHPHGVDLPHPGDLDASEVRRGLLFVGALAAHKGPALVHAAWDSLSSPVPLAFVGPETDPSAVVGIPASMREGPLPPQEILSRMARAQALVMGSIWPENSPLVILEARAAGTPVIAPRIGGIPELVQEGVDGLLYTPGDVQDCARAMAQVLERADWSPRPPPSFEAHLDTLEAHYRSLLG